VPIQKSLSLRSTLGDNDRIFSLANEPLSWGHLISVAVSRELGLSIRPAEVGVMMTARLSPHLANA
jgi:hypothetical protein